MALAVLRSAAIGLDTWLATRIARASVARSAGDGREAGQTPVARKTRVERELTGDLGLDDRPDRQLRETYPFEDVDRALVCEEDSGRGRHLGESGPAEPDSVRERLDGVESEPCHDDATEPAATIRDRRADRRDCTITALINTAASNAARIASAMRTCLQAHTVEHRVESSPSGVRSGTPRTVNLAPLMPGPTAEVRIFATRGRSRDLPSARHSWPRRRRHPSAGSRPETAQRQSQ